MPRESNRGRGVVRTGDSRRGTGIGPGPAPVYHRGPRSMAAPPPVTPLPPTEYDPCQAASPIPRTVSETADQAAGHTTSSEPAAAREPGHGTGAAGLAWPGQARAAAARDGRELRAGDSWPTGTELRTILAAAGRSDSAGARCLRASLARCGLVLRHSRVLVRPGLAHAPLPNSPTDRTRAVLRFTLRHVGRPIGTRRICQAVRELLERQARRELSRDGSCSSEGRRSSCRGARAAQHQAGPLKR